MTEQLSQASLQKMASMIAEPRLRLPQPRLIRCWEIDAVTGRPVSRWQSEPDSPGELP